MNALNFDNGKTSNFSNQTNESDEICQDFYIIKKASATKSDESFPTTVNDPPGTMSALRCAMVTNNEGKIK